MKPKNILLGFDGKLKIADFGLARTIVMPNKPLTQEVITLYYRPPEILLGNYFYNESVDMWSIGCIFYELSALKPLFKYNDEI